MRRAALGALAAVLAIVSFLASAQQDQSAAPAAASAGSRVRFDTSMGSFVVRLYPERAPLTVENFLRYVREGHYDGTIFHRVIDNFVIQGGGYIPDYTSKDVHAPIPNESGNGLVNRRGTLGLARTENPHSGSAQFFINLADNAELNPLPSRWGYAVFGEVIDGMDVVDRIGHVATGKVGPFKGDAPLRQVLIEKATLLE
jgi:cyclophilin family peptidyl-prolyl cis-trans isomerase